MAGQYLYVTKGYAGGWSANSSDLRRSAGGGSWPSVADGNKSAFYRTSGGAWRRWFSGINSDGFDSGFSSSFYEGFTTGIAIVNIETNGSITDDSGTAYWDRTGYPDNPDIEIYGTLASGSMAYVSGTSLGSWHTLNTVRGWTMSCDSGISSDAVIDVQFRHVPTAIVLDTISVSLSVNYISG